MVFENIKNNKVCKFCDFYQYSPGLLSRHRCKYNLQSVNYLTEIQVKTYTCEFFFNKVRAIKDKMNEK